MQYVFEYQSLNEIDDEFIHSIEKLLASEVLSFDNLLEYEDSLDERIGLHYFLFFKETKNEPIGFMMIELIPVDKKFFLGPLSRLHPKNFFKRNQDSGKILKAQIPGLHGMSYVFEPEFLEEGEEEVSNIIAELSEDFNLVAEQWNYPKEGFQSEEDQSINLELVSYDFHNTYSEYSEYFKTIDTSTAFNIKKYWKDIFKYNTTELNEYTHFKEIFRDTDNGIQLYNTLRKSGFVRSILESNRNNKSFLTFEKRDQLLGIIILTHGKKRNIFVDFISINDAEIPFEVYYQYALMKSIEIAASHVFFKVQNEIFSHDITEEDMNSMNITPFKRVSVIETDYNLNKDSLNKCFAPELIL
jgi:hypothetical protein